MAAVRDLLVEPALRRINVLAEGETAPAAQALEALASLNALIDGYALERLTVYEITRTTWTITSSDGTYTIGTGGDIAVARPVNAEMIEHLNYQDTSLSPTQERELTHLTEDAYSRIRQKAQTSTLPQYWYYTPGYPLGTIELIPVPTNANLEGVIYHLTPISEFTTVDDTVTLPPGYRRFLITNLAAELMTEYGKPPDPVLLRQAETAMNNVKRVNHRMTDLSMDPSLIRGFEPYRWYSIETDN
jgi:hypothetical protein